MQVVEALPLPAALKLVSACCGEDLRESDEAAVQRCSLVDMLSAPLEDGNATTPAKPQP